MTSKLKCPFCQTELDYDEYGWDYSCPNHKCRATKGVLCGTKSLWQALIQAKQDLEIAVDALKYYADSRFGKKQDDGTYALEIDKGCGVTVVYTYDPRLAKQTLEQIEHKE